jgi:hypothetical protein
MPVILQLPQINLPLLSLQNLQHSRPIVVIRITRQLVSIENGLINVVVFFSFSFLSSLLLCVQQNVILRTLNAEEL